MSKPKISAGQARAMLARVTADLKTETDPDRASDLRFLKTRIESHLRILGVTIH